MKGKIKCLLNCRTQGLWISSRGRRMTVKEMLRVQGMDPEKIVRAEGVSDAQMAGMAGNGMSQNVLEQVIKQVLKAADLYGEGGENSTIPM